MSNEFNGIERRLNELSERLAKLELLREKTLDEFLSDTYLQDIVERNLEVAAQCCIDLCNKVVSLSTARKPEDYYDAFIVLGEIGVLPSEFAFRIASLAGFRNLLVHEYTHLDWELVYQHLQRIDELRKFGDYIRDWYCK